ncbi:MAG: glycosyltransferase [Bacteroidia bacterium]
MKLAILFFDIPNLSGGGGAERFFYDFFTDYNKTQGTNHELFLITDDLNNIVDSGRESEQSNIIYTKNYKYFNFRFLNFINRKNKYLLGNVINAFIVRGIIKKYKIAKLVVPFYNPREYYFYKLFNYFNVQLDYFIVDCRIPENYLLNSAPYYFYSQYGLFFKNIKFQNIHTWYSSVKEFIEKNKIIAHYNSIRTYNTRYTGVILDYNPGKKTDTIVFAARMDEQKDPLFFLEAIKILYQNPVFSQEKWKVNIYGKGPLLEAVKNSIHLNQLTNVFVLNSANLEEVFVESRIFVSTQKYENFPSLVISEAMAKGNIIIAKNVGQTHLLVREGVNGFLCEENNTGSLADAILAATQLCDSESINMAKSSVSIMKTEHTLNNFIRQFDTKILN